jgi:hypothetical protein
MGDDEARKHEHEGSAESGPGVEAQSAPQPNLREEPGERKVEDNHESAEGARVENRGEPGRWIENGSLHRREEGSAAQRVRIPDRQVAGGESFSDSLGEMVEDPDDIVAEQEFPGLQGEPDEDRRNEKKGGRGDHAREVPDVQRRERRSRSRARHFRHRFILPDRFGFGKSRAPGIREESISVADCLPGGLYREGLASMSKKPFLSPER